MKKICVIGSGIMGSGIAAQIANSQNDVLLLDLELDGKNLAQVAVDRMLEKNSIAHASLLKHVHVGSIEKHLHEIKDFDWIIEAVTEKLHIKEELLSKISAIVQNPNVIISSNTSTIPLKKLQEFVLNHLRPNFIITHFFNPPRFMKLVEIVTTEITDKSLVKEAHDFLTHRMGKTVVPCKDTPGFIANRVGCFFMEMSMRKVIEFGVSAGDADRILAKYFGVPKTGVFGLMDLIGIDLMKLMAESIVSMLPNDRFKEIYTPIQGFNKMIEEGRTGRKSGSGFYDKNKKMLDLKTWTYIDDNKLDLSWRNAEDFLSSDTKEAKCFIEIITEMQKYCESLIPDVSDKREYIDIVMNMGYNWKFSPFDFKNHIKSQKSFDLGVLIDSTKDYKISSVKDCTIFEIKTKMGTLTHEVFSGLNQAIDIGKKLIIINQDKNFSVGADLKLFYNYIKNEKFDELLKFLKFGQYTFQKLQSVSSISCIKGYALGGGFELVLHSSYVLANIESTCGLVECGVGLIPGWGGVKEIISRRLSLDLILDEYKTKSAFDLSEKFLMQNIHINMNSDFILEEALELSETMKMNQQKIKLPINRECKSDKNLEIMNLLLKNLKDIECSEEDLLRVENTLFLELARNSSTKQKIEAIIQ